MDKVWTQNNTFAGAFAIIGGKRMEFDTEDDAREYAERKSFAEVLHEEVQKLEAKYGSC